MGGLHPTCGLLSLQRGTKLIALIDMTLGLIGIIWFVYMMGRYNIISLDAFDKPTGNGTEYIVDKAVLSANHKAISLTLSALFTLINLTVFIILLIGAHRKSIPLCLTWFYIRCSVIVFKLIIFIMYLIAGRPIFSQIPFLFFMLIHMYGIWVVNRFIEEMRSQKNEAKLKASQIKQLNDLQLADKEQELRDGIEGLQKIREAVYSKGQDNEAYEKL